MAGGVRHRRGLLVRAGITVAAAADEIATRMRLGGLLAGLLLLAAATSLPEIVTVTSAAIQGAPDLAASFGAVRIPAFDLAVGNLFGSNAFNMVILFGADLAYTDGPLLTGADPAQAVAGVGAIGLMALALAVIVHGEETRIRRLEPDALVLLIAYVGTLAAVWAASQ